MWPIPTLEHELCTVSFSPDSMTCSWIQKTHNGPAWPSKPCRALRSFNEGWGRSRAPLALRAYKRYDLDNLELAHLTLFNPTIIRNNINSFLQEHNKEDAFVAFSLDGPAITEHCIALPTSTPHRADFGIAHSSNMLWEYRYLYPNDHGQFVFYVYMVPRSLVLQYQLLAIATKCNLITITTQNMALFTAYKHIFGTAFRRSQFGIDMMRRNNRFDLLISNDALRRMVTTSSAVSALENERVNIATACGLFFDERIV